MRLLPFHPFRRLHEPMHLGFMGWLALLLGIWLAYLLGHPPIE